MLLAGVATRLCGDDGNWVDPPDVLECQSLEILSIEAEVSAVTAYICLSLCVCNSVSAYIHGGGRVTLLFI